MQERLFSIDFCNFASKYFPDIFFYAIHYDWPLKLHLAVWTLQHLNHTVLRGPEKGVPFQFDSLNTLQWEVLKMDEKVEVREQGRETETQEGRKRDKDIDGDRKRDLQNYLGPDHLEI